MRLLLIQLQVSAAVLIILVLRIGMRKLPKIYSYGLWLLVFARLLCPIQLESSISFMPSTSERVAWLEQMFMNIEGKEHMSSEENDLLMDWATGITPEMQSDNDLVNQSEIGHASVDAKGQFFEGSDYKGAVGDGGTVGAGGLNMSDGTDGRDVYLGDGDETDLSAGWIPDLAANVDASAGVGTDTIRLNDTGSAASSAGTALPASLGRALYLLWILGTLGILLYNGTVLIKVKRRLQGAQHVEENVYISENIRTPFTLGLLKPRIYLPSGLQEEEREYILCHERVHIKRKDYLFKNLAFLLTAVYWFNPFVWLAFCFLERDMEMACDEKVIRLMGNEIKRRYSQSLLNFARGRDGVIVTPFAFGENGVKQRVKNVLSYSKAKVWSIALGIVILAAAMIGLFTARGEDGQIPDEQPSEAEFGSDYQESMEGTVGKVEAAQTDARTALELWVTAFVDRDGETLRRLAWDKEAFAAWDMVGMRGEELISFGYSSPWPWGNWGDGNETTWQEGDDTALIRFYMANSVPEIYVVDELVSITQADGLYYIDHEQMTEYYSLENREQFEALYGQEDYDFSYRNTGYTTEFFRVLLRQLVETENDDPKVYPLSPGDPETGILAWDSSIVRHSPYSNPLYAAIHLLHLGPGNGSVEYDNVPVKVEGWDIDWLKLMSWKGEGSKAYITYTFDSDGSQVVIPMEYIEGSIGIWAPAGSGALREVYQTRSGAVYGLGTEGETDEVFVQTSQYGIYLLSRQGLYCVYPYYVPEDVCWTIDEGILYFVVNSDLAETDSENRNSSVCMLDLQTGEFVWKPLPISNGQGLWLSVSGGFLHLNMTYHVPLVNTGDGPLRDEIWNGKTATELTEDETDAYSTAVRRQLLEHPGTLLDLSNRTLEETFVLIDIDGDGHAERISLSADSENSLYSWPYDAWRLTLNDSAVTGWSETLYNSIWAVSLDGEEILLAIYEDGPSADPQTTLFWAVDGQLQNVGSFPADITVCAIEEGVITGLARIDVIQTDRTNYGWWISDTGELERAPREYYKFETLNDVELLTELPVHDTPGGQESHMMQPQTVKLVMTDGSMQWVYLEGETGDSGWFLMGDDLNIIAELGTYSHEVFEGLQFVD